MKYFPAFLFSLLLICSCSTKPSETSAYFPTMSIGQWDASLYLSDSLTLPFKMRVKKDGKEYAFSIHNDEETILLSKPIKRNDSLVLTFPYFQSELILLPTDSSHLTGKWRNYMRSDYTIPFEAVFKEKKRNENTASSSFNGKWKTVFSPSSDDNYPALGVFKQNQGVLSGTFLTETGDYRFLSGEADDSSFYLSCFDGSHAFLFTGHLTEKEKLEGSFYSGKHWSTNFVAERNPTFELANPDSLTFLTGSSLRFSLKDRNNDSFTFPNNAYKNKAVIIQVMGTWCPNCLDETNFYKDLYDKYHAEGLEILAVAYEMGDDFEAQEKSVQRYVNKLNIPYPFLIGGKASKSLASKHFPMLSDLISFPTSVFIDRSGKVRRIHTGFNGPGTGSYYKEYVESTEQLVEEMLHGS